MIAHREIDQRLAHRFIVEHPRDAARLLERLAPDEAARALLGSAGAAGRVVAQMDRDAAAACLRSYPKGERAELIESLSADEAARVMRLVPKDERDRILSSCPASVAQPLLRLLRFPEDTAGALMDPNPLTALRDVTVAEARSGLARRADDVLYVIDERAALLGMLSIRDLVRAPGEAPVHSRMLAPVPRIGAHADRDAIIAHGAWQEHHQLPVVDRRDGLVGILRYHTMRRLRGERSGPERTASLGLALGEMYWTMMAALVDTVAKAVPPAGGAGGEQR